MQHRKVSDACIDFGLTISIKKTEVCISQLQGNRKLSPASQPKTERGEQIHISRQYAVPERCHRRHSQQQLQEGLCTQGGQKKRFKDTLKISVKAFAINPNTWEHIGWHSSLYKGGATCEANRTAAVEQRRQAKNSRASDPMTPHAAPIPCPHCQRTFQIADWPLFSHLRTHRSTQPAQPQMTEVVHGPDQMSVPLGRGAKLHCWKIICSSTISKK